MIKLATWNVNSLKVRLDQVLAWFESANVDVLALQETKVVDEQFPLEAFTERGFSVVFSGQKTYNGVAIIGRMPLEDAVMDIPQLIDPQRRVLATTVAGIRLINLYVPNGSEPGSDKYHYKLMWLSHVTEFIKQQLQSYPKLAVVGDFNIAPADRDVHDPKAWEGQVLVSEPERKAFTELLALGLKDSFREAMPETQSFSWWDYRAAGFRRNMGLRIDHILLSNPLFQDCTDVGIDLEPRRSERPSDHTPVWALLNLH